DPAPATTQHFDNRASCFSLDSTSASYQEALLSCPCTRHLTRSSTVFEARPTTHTDREQPVRLGFGGAGRGGDAAEGLLAAGDHLLGAGVVPVEEHQEAGHPDGPAPCGNRLGRLGRRGPR